MGQIVTILMVITGGVGLSLQAAMNTKLKTEAGSPVMSALISFVVGGVALALLVLVGAFGRGHLPPARSLPAWAWLGGLMGAFYVAVAPVALPRIGQSLLVGATMLGQLTAAMVLDSYGWLGVPRLPLNPMRLLGALLLIAGVFLMGQRK